jgi:catechol 2,3-dioxygenase-like lactoylglutathione lyase family enzyme
VARFHHVNLGVPVGGLDAEEAFLMDFLGYRRVEVPPELAGAVHWFESEDGLQVHLSEDPEHRPAGRAHVAIGFGDDLAQLEAAFDRAGYPYAPIGDGAGRVLFCQDPSGNRWELRGAGR